MATLAPTWLQQFPGAENGTLEVYAAGTTTPVVVYRDAAESQAHPWPVPLDPAGRVTLFLPTGSFRFVLKNSGGVTIWDVDQVASIDESLRIVPGTLELIQPPSAPAVAPVDTARLFFDGTTLRISADGQGYGDAIAPVIWPLGGDYAVAITATTPMPSPDQVLVEIDGTRLGSRTVRLITMGRVSAGATGTVRLFQVSANQAISGSALAITATTATRYESLPLSLPATVAVYRAEASVSPGGSVWVWGVQLFVR